MVNRQTAAFEIGDKAAMDGLNFHQLRPLREQLERVFRRAFKSLEKDRLIEPASGMNGTYMEHVDGGGRTAVARARLVDGPPRYGPPVADKGDSLASLSKSVP